MLDALIMDLPPRSFPADKAEVKPGPSYRSVLLRELSFVTNVVLLATGTIDIRFRICQQKNIHQKMEMWSDSYRGWFRHNGGRRGNLSVR